MNLAGQHILVLGFGKSGQAAARYCAGLRAHVIVSDSRPEAEFAGVLPRFANLGIQFEFGGHREAVFEGADLIVTSPGIPESTSTAAARKRGVPVVSDIELALHEISAPVVAVTGTNGKSTTTALIGHLCAASGQKVCVAGNIGTSLLEALDEARAADVVVLEVSSYQLEITPSLKPKVAVYLNLTADHLDRYGTMAAYAAAKAKLFHNQGPEDVAIYNSKDAGVTQAAATTRAQKVPFDAEKTVLPWTLADTTLMGAHNLENMMAAVLAVQALGVRADAITKGLKTFKGLPHRLQLVREVSGVKYYDDSKGTNIGAVQKSLAGFSEPIHLIAGGLGKGTRYTDLRPAVKAHVRTLILMGTDRQIMKEDLGDLAATHLVNSMREAVVTACDVAHPGDVVLLSPACASFDMFRDYADRGNQFADCVKELVA
jgi:UDP-N-acetylmuramoylalanine--D-glutamate ligase